MTQLTDPTSPPQAGPHRLVDLDATRGLAALLVFSSHLFFFAGAAAPGSIFSKVVHGLLRRLLDGGAAVDYFFVLSGFVLALPATRSRDAGFSVPEFLARRVVRIMPTYWVALAVALGLRAWVNATGMATGSSSSGLLDWVTPLTPGQIFAAAGLIFQDFDVRLINGPIWSLSVEMQISLLLPLVILALGPRQSVAGTLGILGVSLFFSARLQGTFLFLPLFVAGAALARHHLELVRRTEALSTAATVLLFVIACGLFWNRQLQSLWAFPDPRQEWLSGVGGVCLIVLVLAQKAPQWLLRNKGSQLLGQVSYSFYLIHLPILQAAEMSLQGRGLGNGVVLAVSGLFAVVGSVALYVAVERPSIAWGRRLSRWPRWSSTRPAATARPSPTTRSRR